MLDLKTNAHLLRCSRTVAAHKEPSHITVARAAKLRILLSDGSDSVLWLTAIQEACSAAEIAEKTETTIARAQAYHAFLDERTPL